MPPSKCYFIIYLLILHLINYYYEIQSLLKACVHILYQFVFILSQN